MKRLLAVGLAAGILLGGLSCNSDTTDDVAEPPVGSPAATEPATDEVVTIDDFAYEPDSVTVEVGTRVGWKNNDSREHTVTADNKAFDSGTIAVNGQFIQLFEQVGTYDYHCEIHGEDRMSGRVTVVAE